MKLIFLAVFSAVLGTVLAQSGSGAESSVSYAGTVRLPDETFTADLEDKTSAAYISLKDQFEEELKAEIKDELTSRSYSFSSVSVNVTSFSSGSIIVNFILIVDGTPISVNDLVEAAETASGDSTIGSFTAEQIQDLDECQETSTGCSDFADCVNTVGSFICNCNADYFDESGDGTVCVTPVAVLCETSRMQISISKEYLDSLSINLDDLRLNDENCGGILDFSSNGYQFSITDDLSTCGSIAGSNDSHVTYENTLSNLPKTSDVIQTGTNVSIPFSCSYPKNLNTTLSFEGDVSSINISTAEGGGTFEVDFQLYSSDTFETEETRTVFKTTDKLYLQAGLNSQDSSLTVVMDKCWASPSNSLEDSTQYNIITDGCPVSTAVGGSIEVLANGENNKSRFSVQVFTFIDETTTFIHCSLAVCSSSSGGACQPDCTASSSSRKRRDIRDYSTVALTRKRRETEREQDKTVGPLHRETYEGVDVRFWSVTMSLVAFVLVLLIIIAYLVARRRSGAEPKLAGMKMKEYTGVENSVYS